MYIAVDCWIGLNRIVTSKDTVLLICLNQRSGVKRIPQHWGFFSRHFHESSQSLYFEQFYSYIWDPHISVCFSTYYFFRWAVLKGGWLANQSISQDPSLLIQTCGICRYLQWQLTERRRLGQSRLC